MTLEADEPASKKRKTENGVLPVRNSGSTPSSKLAFQAKDISFSIPQRKKLHLELCEYGDVGAKPVYLLLARNPASNDVELSVPLGSYSEMR